MSKVRWTKTIKGRPLAFSGCGLIVKGEEADVSAEMAAKAITAKLAEPVKESAPARPAPKPKGGE